MVKVLLSNYNNLYQYRGYIVIDIDKHLFVSDKW